MINSFVKNYIEQRLLAVEEKPAEQQLVAVARCSSSRKNPPNKTHWASGKLLPVASPIGVPSPAPIDHVHVQAIHLRSLENTVGYVGCCDEIFHLLEIRKCEAKGWFFPAFVTRGVGRAFFKTASFWSTRTHWLVVTVLSTCQIGELGLSNLSFPIMDVDSLCPCKVPTSCKKYCSFV